MIRILTASQMTELERRVFSAGAKDLPEEYMNHAGRQVADVAQAMVGEVSSGVIVLLCGFGNNSGDAYVCGRCLIDAGYSVVAVRWFSSRGETPLCRANRESFLSAGGSCLEASALPGVLERAMLVVDGIFGIGFRGEVNSFLLDAFERIEDAGKPVLAIDVPSGVGGDTLTGGAEKSRALKATVTVALELPKWAIFSKGNWEKVGRLVVRPFGLDENALQSVEPAGYWMTEHDIAPCLPRHARCLHKYQRGVLGVLSGRPGMMGALSLCAEGAQRAGCGLVYALHQGVRSPCLAREVISYDVSHVDSIPAAPIRNANAWVLGPGMGANLSLLRAVMARTQGACVFDADALTLVSQAADLAFPSGSVLTPHLGELARILGRESRIEGVDDALLDQVRAYARSHRLCFVIKGAPTFVVSPSGETTVLTEGNSGMATAGSGDVLAGMIGSFLAQGLSAVDAARVGVYLHGRAGDRAAERLGWRSLRAGDLLVDLPRVLADIEPETMPSLPFRLPASLRSQQDSAR